MEILASRMLIRPADYQRSLRFYRDEVGLEWENGDYLAAEDSII